MLRGEAYFLAAEVENNNGGKLLTKQAALNWLQKYIELHGDRPASPWFVSRALNLLAGIRPEIDINTEVDPAFPIDEGDLKLREARREASQALALVLNECEDVKHRKGSIRFFEFEFFRFALRIKSDVDLLKPEQYLVEIENETLPLRLYLKVGAVLFSHEYFSRDVPLFGLFHDFVKEKEGKAVYERIDGKISERLRDSLIKEHYREAERHDMVPWDMPDYDPVPYVEPVFSCQIDLVDKEQLVSLPLNSVPSFSKVAGDDLEIVPDVTVGNVRALFDRNGDRYSAELAAAVWAWASFEHDPSVADGFTIKDEIKNGRLPDWGDPLLPTARERIATVVNWKKTPAKS